MLGAFVAGVAAGIRVQTIWLTAPLLVLMAFQQRRAGVGWLASGPLAFFTIGVAVWAIPLVADSGGIDGYLRALSSQAGEDFAWVNMLWLEPTPRRLAFALYETFVLPWGSTALAGVVIVAATAGLIVATMRERRALALLLVAFAPYAMFHLLFQETVMVRYALPTVPMVAWLAASGAALLGRVGSPWRGSNRGVGVDRRCAAGCGLWPLTSPRLPGHSGCGTLRAHRSSGGGLFPSQRLACTSGRQSHASRRGAATIVPVAGSGVVLEGRRQLAVWFFADPRRTDLALIDPWARADVVRYPWAVADRPELSGARPTGTDWYRITPPGWFAEEGWSLTPETGGLAGATAAGPDHRPIVAWVRRRPDPVHLMIGGRHLGVAGDPAAEFELALDGVVRDRWTLTFDERNFLRFLDIPEGLAGADRDYARLTVVSRAVGDDGRRAPVAVRQFDIQSRSRLVYGFADGWHEMEYDVPPVGDGAGRASDRRSGCRVRRAPSP